MLEHLVSLARSRDIRAFTAETLSENALMLRVFADAGFSRTAPWPTACTTSPSRCPSARTTPSAATVTRWPSGSGRPVWPACGTCWRRPRSRSSAPARGRLRRRAILHNIVTGGFPGPVYAVNPAVDELDGVPCVPSAAATPEGVDLAVIATPAAAVIGIAEECGQRGVKALVVLAAGLNGAARAELLGICRRHGMRMVGPASFGVADTSAGWTRRSRPAIPGREALAWRSSRPVAPASPWPAPVADRRRDLLPRLARRQRRRGRHDMLLWWESDPATKLALLYVESIANPPKFARTARHVGRSVPVLTVIAGRSIRARLAGARAVAATPLLTRQALFEQAGVIVTANLGELLDTAVLLASQRAPAGPRVAVVSNTRGAAVLAADACYDAGLQVARLAGDTRQALRDLLPRDATVAGPVDTTLLVGPGLFGQCLELVGADPGVDAVLALTTTSAGSDPAPEVPAARLPVPIAATVLGQVEVVRLLRGPGEDSPPFRPMPALRVRRLRPRPRRPLRHVAGDPAGKRARPRRPAPGPCEGSGRGISEPEGRQAAGWHWTRPWNSSAATACRWQKASGSSRRTPPSRRQHRFGGPVALRADVPGLVRARGSPAPC